MLSFLRLRRHRVPIVLAIFFILVLYQFSSLRSSSDGSQFAADRLKEYTSQSVKEHNVPLPKPPAEPKKPDTDPVSQPEHEAGSQQANIPLPEPVEIPPPPKEIETSPPTPQTPTTAAAKPETTIPTVPQRVLPGDGRHSKEYYAFPPAFYALPTPVIALPEDEPIAIPQIQADFKPESASDKSLRLQRQKAVKDAFLRSWNFYKENAFGHDEVRPVTGAFNDKFGGWGATLVDALDTLWIMDLKEDFAEAVEAVGKIEFTTTTVSKIQVFETVIRYLGGLIGAWDLCGQKEEYKVLLEKAKELADVLFGAFDTPNRMPLLNYAWRAKAIEQHPRAEARAVAAELGSLTLEFTRLAQITGNHSYYDVVARITDALDEFQFNTSMPGLWPMYIDTSGCKRVKASASVDPDAGPKPTTGLFSEPGKGDSIFARPGGEEPVKPVAEESTVLPGGATEQPIHVPAVVGGTGKEVFTQDISQEAVRPSGGGAVMSESSMARVAKSGAGIGPPMRMHNKREQEDGNSIEKRYPVPKMPYICESQGLVSPRTREEKFGLGAMIDSLYEYLIKEYLLLGGSEQYKRLYASSMDIAGKELTFRPNVPGNPDVLLAGNVHVQLGGMSQRFEPEASHLACFAGGMFAMGAQVLDRPDDLTIGSKLTDGCVWAYGSMRSGIMPESFKVMACANKTECTFSRDTWVTEMSPPESYVQRSNARAEMDRIRMQEGRMKAEGHHSPQAAAMNGNTPIKAAVEHAAAEAVADPEVALEDKAAVLNAAIEVNVDETPTPVHYPQKRSEPLALALNKTATDFAEELIAAEDLPEGFLALNDRRYILRPEAIESVWYMYRISADKSWQEKGWGMWTAIDKAVSIPDTGVASAIKDVSMTPDDDEWQWENSMESFWFGETLKYFYLLFSTPDVISLDEYVLNTEAHPFRRADFGKRGTAAKAAVVNGELH